MGVENLKKNAIYLEKHADEFSPQPQYEFLVQYVKKSEFCYALFKMTSLFNFGL